MNRYKRELEHEKKITEIMCMVCSNCRAMRWKARKLLRNNYPTENIVQILRKSKPIEVEHGEWVLKEHLWECDQCGCRINRANPLKGNIWNYNFCPNCGVKMFREDGET